MGTPYRLCQRWLGVQYVPGIIVAETDKNNPNRIAYGAVDVTTVMTFKP